MGYFCTYVKGIYIVIVTFAFAQIFSLIVMADPGGITDGENGIIGVRPGSISLGGLEVDLFKGIGLYYLSLMIFIGSYFIIKVIVNSQIGDVFKGIKHNEERMLSLGYNTRPYQILAFVFSASISAVAGVLFVFMDNTISPGIVDWSVGAEALLFCVLGSPGTLIGPVIAALLITFLKYYVSSWFGGGNWVYILGGMYIAVIMFMPGGLLNTRIFRFLNQNFNE